MCVIVFVTDVVLGVVDRDDGEPSKGSLAVQTRSSVALRGNYRCIALRCVVVICVALRCLARFVCVASVL